LTGSGTTGLSFSCHKGELPLIYVFAFLATSEMVLTHWLISLWSIQFALLVSTATVALLAATSYFGLRAILRPIILAEDGIIIPCGGAAIIVLAYDNLSEIRFIAFAPEPKGSSTYRRTAMGHPNFLLCLRNPIRHRTLARTRTFDRICIRVDDPAGFGPALQSRAG
jgi:hypothetical protein